MLFSHLNTLDISFGDALGLWSFEIDSLCMDPYNVDEANGDTSKYTESSSQWIRALETWAC